MSAQVLLVMSKKSNRRQIVPSRALGRSSQAFAGFGEPAVSAVRLTRETAQAVYDPIEKELRDAKELPPRFPKEWRNDTHQVRFHYRLVNRDQAEHSFQLILDTYVEYVIKKGKEKANQHPCLEEYLMRDPLGLNVPPSSDPLYYRNANKLSRPSEPAPAAGATPSTMTPTAGAGGTSASTVIPVDTSSADGASATASTIGNMVTDKSATKKKKKKRGKPRPQPGNATVAGAASPPPSGSTPTTKVLPVLTDFARALQKAQRQVYLHIRATLPLFMDSVTHQIISTLIKEHEQKHDLRGEARVAIATRYKYEDIKHNTYTLCCRHTVGGFYFLPLYTTHRDENTLIGEWCTEVVTLHSSIEEFNPQWGTLAERDAVKRLTDFFSPKENEIIKAELHTNHAKVWKQHHQKLAVYYSLVSLKNVVALVDGIDAGEYPTGFDPWKHCPSAMKETLFTYTDVSRWLDEKDELLELVRAKIKPNAKKRTSRDRTRQDGEDEDEPRKKKSRPKLKGTRERDASGAKGRYAKERPEVRALMVPNVKGQMPCLKCARELGRKLFHPHDLKCTRSYRERLRKKFSKQPDDEEKVTYSKGDYAPGACTVCIRENVKPSLAKNHQEEQCFRRKGGECDQKGAKTPEERDKVCEALRKERYKASQERRREKQEKAKGNRKKKRSKTTSSARRPVRDSKKVRFRKPSPSPESRTSSASESEEAETSRTTASSFKFPERTTYASHRVPPDQEVGDPIPKGSKDNEIGAAPATVDTPDSEPETEVSGSAGEGATEAAPPPSTEAERGQQPPQKVNPKHRNRGKRYRTRVYPVSAHAKANPLTEEELHFARHKSTIMREFLQEENLRYCLTVAKHPERLQALRDEMAVYKTAFEAGRIKGRESERNSNKNREYVKAMFKQAEKDQRMAKARELEAQRVGVAKNDGRARPARRGNSSPT